VQNLSANIGRLMNKVTHGDSIEKLYSLIGKLCRYGHCHAVSHQWIPFFHTCTFWKNWNELLFTLDMQYSERILLYLLQQLNNSNTRNVATDLFFMPISLC
jgi:hypothetical protein